MNKKQTIPMIPSTLVDASHPPDVDLLADADTNLQAVANSPVAVYE